MPEDEEGTPSVAPEPAPEVEAAPEPVEAPVFQDAPAPRAEDIEPIEPAPLKRYKQTSVTGGGMSGGRVVERVIEQPADMTPPASATEVDSDTPLKDWELQL